MHFVRVEIFNIKIHHVFQNIINVAISLEIFYKMLVKTPIIKFFRHVTLCPLVVTDVSEKRSGPFFRDIPEKNCICSNNTLRTGKHAWLTFCIPKLQ